MYEISVLLNKKTPLSRQIYNGISMEIHLHRLKRNVVFSKLHFTVVLNSTMVYGIVP